MTGVPLARLLSKRGFCSRAEGRRLVLSGAVRVDGRPCLDPVCRIPAGARISVSGHEARPAIRRVTLALHKPRGVLTTSKDPEGRPTVFDLLPPGTPRLVAAGRLDQASRGLLILTNDTALADRLTSPSAHIPKTYNARLDRRLSLEEVSTLAAGAVLDAGVTTRPCRVRILREGRRSCWLELVLTEGLNRQVRRMARTLGAEVTDLVGVSIGGLALGDLAAGSCRSLDAGDLRRLFHLSSTIPA